LQIWAVLVAALGGYVCYAQDVLDPIILYLARGDIEYTTSLSNRLPLWDILLADLEKHPWTGAGFAVFWSPENYARLELIIGRSAVSAHNGYLEELLNITNSLAQDFLQFHLLLILTFLGIITSKRAIE
jgi:O-antigen ligase